MNLEDCEPDDEIQWGPKVGEGGLYRVISVEPHSSGRITIVTYGHSTKGTHRTTHCRDQQVQLLERVEPITDEDAAAARAALEALL